MDLRALAKSSALYTIGNLAMRMVGFLMIPVYTRYLTPADYGLIELIDLLIGVASITLGIQAMSSSLIRIYHDSKDPAWQARVVSTALLATAAVSLVLSVLGAAFSTQLSLAMFNTSEHATLLAVAFSTVVVGSARTVGLTYLRIHDRALHYVLVSLATLAVNLSLNIYLIVFRGMGVWGFVLSNLVSATLGTLYLGTITFREVGIKWDWEPARRMWRFGSPLIFGGLAMFGMHFLDRFVLIRYASLTSVGLYALGYKFGFLMTYLVGGPFHRAWNARLYAYTHEDGWQEKFAQVFVGLIFVLAFVWTGLSALIDETVTIMAAPSFHTAAAFVPWIALAYVARTLGDFFRTLLYINKRSGLATKIVVVCAILNAILAFLLIPTLGGWGATWATLITWLAYTGAMWYFAQREHKLPLPYRQAATLGGIALVLWLGSEALAGLPLILSAAGSLLIALGFLPLAWWLGCIGPTQKDVVRRQVRAIWLRLRGAS